MPGFNLKFASMLGVSLASLIAEDWKDQHAFDYVRAPAGKIKVQQACQLLQVWDRNSLVFIRF